MAKLLLFDIDGTLLRAHGAGLKAMAAAGRAVLGETFSLDGVDFAGNLDPLIFRTAAEQSGLSHDAARHAQFRDLYVRLLEQELTTEEPRIERLPGVRELFDELLEDAHSVLGLLTGNYRASAHAKLRHAGIVPDWFCVGAFGDAAPTRPELVPVAMAQCPPASRAALNPRDVLVIGDTPRDVQCAKVNGCRALAVATGSYSASELDAEGADWVIEDLTQASVIHDFLAT